MIIFLSIIGFLSFFFIFVLWIGLLGFVLIYMGVKGLLLFCFYKSNEVIDNVIVLLFKVVLIILVNGVDNILIYILMFVS